MYEYQFDYINNKYNDNAKMCFIGIHSFTIYIVTEDFYEDKAKSFYDIAKAFDNSSQILINQF